MVIVADGAQEQTRKGRTIQSKFTTLFKCGIVLSVSFSLHCHLDCQALYVKYCWPFSKSISLAIASQNLN